MQSNVVQQGGFTLIEGMVASAILTIGLLALAGMQGISLGRNVTANESGRVTNIAADMVERIKFNRQNALSYQALNTTIGCAGIPAAQVMARGDCTQWKALVDNSGLPAALGTVAVVRLDADPTLNPVTLNQFSVVVSMFWTANAQSGPQAKTAVFTTVLAPE